MVAEINKHKKKLGLSEVIQISQSIEMSNNQMEILKKEIESTSPLISDIIGMDVFKAEFENHAGFLMKINVLFPLN